MKSTDLKFRDSLIIGAALFSMFFGAGNMIFPPFLGFGSGTDWWQGFIGYFVTDIGLVIVTLMAVVRFNGQKELLSIAGKGLASALLFVVIMCLGPIISIPRTAATTYELSVLPIFGEQKFPWFYVVFFTVVLLLCFNKGKILDVVGKILTPLLFLGLLVLIVKGIVTPVGEITADTRFESVIGEGIEAGYQSMDVLASVVFGALVISSVADRGYNNNKSSARIVLYSGLIAGFGLFVVYLGLTYLGATACENYSMHITRTELLTNIILLLFPGKSGLVFFGVVAGLACLSTAVALTGSAAEYLERLFKGKVNYKVFVVAICVLDTLLATVGVEKLVSFASPLLSLVYPPILVIVALSFAKKYLGKLSICFGVLTALICGVYEVFASFGYRIRAIDRLPFNDVGLFWITPVIVMIMIGVIVDLICKKKNCQG
ncbi:MAG: branched-chain amino acid transport system II carrier protein [Ruminococcaceae bacterium]|nr:branched-chain amino acid transport system II carrier protein [Oscillospiraceae bacterium]